MCLRVPAPMRHPCPDARGATHSMPLRRQQRPKQRAYAVALAAYCWLHVAASAGLPLVLPSYPLLPDPRYAKNSARRAVATDLELSSVTLRNATYAPVQGVVACYVDHSSGRVTGVQANGSPPCPGHATLVPVGEGLVTQVKVAYSWRGDWVDKVVLYVVNDGDLPPVRE